MKYRNLKARLLAGALALVMTVGMGMTPAMAADEPLNTFTVNGAVLGAEYKLYKLLELDRKENAELNGATVITYRYSYSAALKGTIGELVRKDEFRYVAKTGDTDTNPRHGYGFKVDGDVDANGHGDVVFVTPDIIDSKTGEVDYDSAENSIVRTMMVEFADELRKLVDAGSLEAAQTVTADSGTVSFENVQNGYWLITSNAGARSIVFTSPGEDAQDLTLDEKNPAPTVDKKVFDNDDINGSAAGGGWRDVNDAQIGDEVKFKITVDLYRGAENIAVHDEMDTGLTFKALDGVNFYPRSTEKDADGTTKFNRVVYKLTEAGKPDPGTSESPNTTDPAKGLSLVKTKVEGDETVAVRGEDGNAILKADVAELAVNPDGTRGFTLTLKNAFTNPAAKAVNRDQSESKNNVFLGDLSTLEDDGGRLVIEYTATVNENAVYGGGKLTCTDATAEHAHGAACYEGDGNGNKSYVKYGHIVGVESGEDPETPSDPPHTSNEDKTKTYTYTFDIDKFVMGDTETKLAGAKFELRKNFVGIGTEAVTKDGYRYAWVEGGDLLKLPSTEYAITGDPIALVPVPDGDTGTVYRVAKPGEAGTTTEIVTNESGKITIQGLDSNLYSITETHAPEGYVKMTAPSMMAIGSAFSGKGGTVFTEDMDATSKRTEGDDYTFKALADATVGIANASGSRMPTTGGIGTTAFYVGGGVMVALAAGAGVAVLKKRRDGDAE